MILCVWRYRITVCIKFYKLQSTVHEDVYVNVLQCDCLSVQVVIAGLSVSVTVIESVKGCACQCMKIVKDLEYDLINFSLKWNIPPWAFKDALKHTV